MRRTTHVCFNACSRKLLVVSVCMIATIYASGCASVGSNTSTIASSTSKVTPVKRQQVAGWQARVSRNSLATGSVKKKTGSVVKKKRGALRGARIRAANAKFHRRRTTGGHEIYFCDVPVDSTEGAKRSTEAAGAI